MWINKKKKNCRQIDVAVPVDHKLEVKENEKIKKYLDRTSEQLKAMKNKVTVVPIVIAALGTVSKSLKRGIL